MSSGTTGSLEVREICAIIFETMLTSGLAGKVHYTGKSKGDSKTDGIEKRFFYFRYFDESIPKGECAYAWYVREDPRSEAVPEVCSNKTCASIKGENLKKCAGCKGKAAYCSTECQRKHWGEHSNSCRSKMTCTDFWTWFMAGKCALVHHVFAKLVKTLTGAESGLSEGTVTFGGRPVLDVMIYPGEDVLRYAGKNAFEVVSVYDEKPKRSVCLPKEGNVERLPKITDHLAKNVDRLGHGTKEFVRCADVMSCANRAHLLVHQMASMAVCTRGDRVDFDFSIVMMDMTGAQYGVGLPSEYPNLPEVRFYETEEELISDGYAIERFKPVTTTATIAKEEEEDERRLCFSSDSFCFFQDLIGFDPKDVIEGQPGVAPITRELYDKCLEELKKRHPWVNQFLKERKMRNIKIY